MIRPPKLITSENDYHAAYPINGELQITGKEKN